MELLMAGFLVVETRSQVTYSQKRPSMGKTRIAGTCLIPYNLVAMDEIGYKRCKTPAGAQVLRTGHEEIELASGANYFICNVPGHCQTGMKISINVA
jgi:hypothetical protein